jgi:DNA-binding transcriptional LysR family regulator
LDAAVCFQDAAAPRCEHDGLRRIDLVEEPMLAILAATHRLAGREQIALRDLADEPWMAPSTEGILVDACRSAGFEPRIVIHTRDPLAARAIAAAGLAVSLTPSLLAHIPLPGIATPALRHHAPHRTLYAVLPDAGAHPLASPLVEALTAAATTH